MDKPMSVPNEPGLWEREGKFYRVWHDGYHDRIQHIDAHNGFFGDSSYLENAPTGNWRKLTAEPAGEASICSQNFPDGSVPKTLQECAEGWKQHYERMLRDWQLMCKQRDLLQKELCEVVARYDEPGGMPVTRGYRNLREMIERLQAKSTPSPPEVIEGRGQAVGDKAGWYWCYPPEWSNGNNGVLQLEATDFFTDECRFIRVIQPVLPPRATFQPSEKPELVLCRNKERGSIGWALNTNDGFVTTAVSGECIPVTEIEVIDPTTGKPIEGGE